MPDESTAVAEARAALYEDGPFEDYAKRIDAFEEAVRNDEARKWKAHIEAAVRASERSQDVREALISADSMMTLMWHRYRHSIPDTIESDFHDAMQAVLKVSRRRNGFAS